MHSTPNSPLLVSLHGLHETVAAGYGSAMAYVRTLDDVSFSLRERDLVLVTGSPAAGSAALVRAVAGRRRIVQGSRALSPGVQVRRACIPADAARVIIAAWSACMQRPRAAVRDGGRDMAAGSRVRTAYIFRVRGGQVNTQANAHSHLQAESWRAWVRMLYGAGGAVMLWTPDTSRAAAAGLHARQFAWGDRVHEPGASVADADGAFGGAASPTQTGRVRRLTLAAGRIVVERTIAEEISEARWRPSSWWGGSDGARSPTGFRRSPTGSTGPSRPDDDAPPAASAARSPCR